MGTVVDPWEAEEHAELRTPDFWGQLFIDAANVKLQKGAPMGRVPWDPGLHGDNERCTALEFLIVPLPESGYRQDIKRNLIAETADWLKHGKPSLGKIGQSLRGANKKWCHARSVPTGKNYTDKHGETKPNTTLEFIAIYETEADCRAAFEAQQVNGAGTPQGQAQAQGAPRNSGMAPAAALAMITSAWNMYKPDTAKLDAFINGNAPIAACYNIHSPEVAALTAVNVPF